VHGEAGLRSRCDEWFEGECEAVYPTLLPEEGLLPLSRGGDVVIDGMPVENHGEPLPILTPPTNEELMPSPRPSPVDTR
jgi:hypothetical protein